MYLKRLDVNKLALLLFSEGIIPQPNVGGHRKRFWAFFGHEHPTQIIVTDGATKQHPASNKIGVMEYRVVDDPTYVLIVERDEERARWVIRYAYFFHKHRLRADSLMYQLRLFSGVDLPPGLLESLFAAVRQHHR